VDNYAIVWQIRLRSACEIFGYDKKEILGQSINSLFPAMYSKQLLDNKSHPFV